MKKAWSRIRDYNLGAQYMTGRKLKLWIKNVEDGKIKVNNDVKEKNIHKRAKNQAKSLGGDKILALSCPWR